MMTGEKKSTEIIVEKDEMEDGSIFVCFMCEKEFNKVSLLNDHMQLHQNMPELHTEFPTRRRGQGRPAGSAGRGRGRARGRGRGQVVQDHGRGMMVIKQEPQTVHKQPTIVIKSEPDPDSDPEMYIPSPVKKAERIRQYFQNLDRASQRTQRPLIQPGNDLDEFDDPELQLLGEEMMMVVPPITKKAAPVKRSFAASATIATGPVIMNPEPEGFICPTNNAHTFNTTSASSGRVQGRGRGRPRGSTNKKNVKIRKKLIVQEVVYEEVTDDEMEDGEEEESNESNGSFVRNNIIIKQQNQSSRGRKKKIITRDDELDEEELIELPDDEDEVMEFPMVMESDSHKKPGRRSQPRVAEEEGGIPCEECGKEFRSVTTLRVHMKAHMEVKDIPCPYCDETFPQRHVLHQHLVNDHEESNNLTCPVCQKVFTRTDSLKSHMVRMHEEDGGLNCYICGKNFPSQGQLEMHVRVHTGERPFKCDYCGKGFVQKVHLRTHLRTMHNMQEIQNTPCRICNAMLDGRAGLREHYNTIHGLTNSQYKTRVAKLRKEGKIPELPPPVVKEVDPSLNYYKVDVSEEVSNQAAMATTTVPIMASTTSTRTYTRRGRGAARLHQARKSVSNVARTVSSGTTTAAATRRAFTVKMEVEDDDDDDDDDDDYDDDDEPRRRDQEELSIVESAFKVAEQMDQLEGSVPGSTTILVAGEDSATTGVYYAIPVVVDNVSSSAAAAAAANTTTSTTSDTSDGDNTTTVTTNGTITTAASTTLPDLDDEYAQFAAEHSQLPLDSFSHEGLVGKGSIVKAEPLQLFSDPTDQSETVEMFTM